MLRFLVMLMIMGATLAHAAETLPPHSLVLIVDMKRILDDSKASIRAQKKIEAQRSAFQDEISVKEKNIRAAEQELQQQRGKLDEKAYAEKEVRLREQFRDVEKYVQERRQALEKATSTSLGTVRDVMQTIVADIAKKRGAQVVLTKQGVLWTGESSDITAEVSSRLNAELPDVPVNIDVPEMKKETVK